jgi:hypothetical protein
VRQPGYESLDFTCSELSRPRERARELTRYGSMSTTDCRSAKSGQVLLSLFPQLEQNSFDDGFSVPHLEQKTSDREPC